MNRAICKGCGKEIFWVKTLNGKNMPCDPEVVRIRIQKGARHRFVLETGEVVSGEYAQNEGTDAVPAYETHWRSCKAAGAFRKEKR